MMLVLGTNGQIHSMKLIWTSLGPVTLGLMNNTRYEFYSTNIMNNSAVMLMITIESEI